MPPPIDAPIALLGDAKFITDGDGADRWRWDARAVVGRARAGGTADCAERSHRNAAAVAAAGRAPLFLLVLRIGADILGS